MRFLRNILRESNRPGFCLPFWVERRLLSAAVLCVALGLTTVLGASAQIPTPQQARRLIQEDPELVRQQLLRSGLSEQEIRARLAAAGLPSDALNQFLSGDLIDATTAFDDDALSGLESLGIAVETADGLEFVTLSTGLQRGFAREPILVNGLPVFGLDVFTRASTLFQPLLSGPVPDDYVLGPGDEMTLILTGEVELAQGLAVTREGFVVVSNVGRISVANLTMAELRVLLRTRLANSYAGIDRGTVFVDVALTQVRTIQIYSHGRGGPGRRVSIGICGYGDERALRRGWSHGAGWPTPDQGPEA